MSRRLFSAVLLSGMALTFASGADAACNATVNGQPMSMELCQAVWQIYGGVLPGHYGYPYEGPLQPYSSPAGPPGRRHRATPGEARLLYPTPFNGFAPPPPGPPAWWD